MRTPYGAHNQRLEKIISNLGYRAFLWNLATRDWLLKKNATLILDTVRKDLEKPSFAWDKKSLIILQHDTTKATLDIQDQLIKYILSKKFKIVSLNQCIGESSLDDKFRSDLETIKYHIDDGDEQTKFLYLTRSILTFYQIFCFFFIFIILFFVFFKNRYIFCVFKIIAYIKNRIFK